MGLFRDSGLWYSRGGKVAGCGCWTCPLPGPNPPYSLTLLYSILLTANTVLSSPLHDPTCSRSHYLSSSGSLEFTAKQNWSLAASGSSQTVQHVMLCDFWKVPSATGTLLPALLATVKTGSFISFVITCKKGKLTYPSKLSFVRQASLSCLLPSKKY